MPRKRCRRFKYILISKLSDEEAADAIINPAKELNVIYEEESVEEIKKWSEGYPYFIQELCDTVWEYTDKEVIAKADVERVIPTFQTNLDRCTKKMDFTVPQFNSFLKRINPGLEIEKE